MQSPNHLPYDIRTLPRERKTVVKLWKCTGCEAFEGQLHKPDCPHEVQVCNVCGSAFENCHCDMEGRDEEERKRYRMPFVKTHDEIACVMCGKLPKEYIIPDKSWEEIVPPSLWFNAICIKCYGKLQLIIPNGWRKAK